MEVSILIIIDTHVYRPLVLIRRVLFVKGVNGGVGEIREVWQDRWGERG